MELEQIHNEWEKDSKIDKSNLADEAINVPSLHHKYWKFFTGEKFLFKKLEIEMKSFYKLKKEYYLGQLSKEDLSKHGWEPFQLKILRDDVGSYISADEEVIQKNLALSLQQDKLELLTDIIKIIHVRNFSISNRINILKFENGN